MVLKATEETKMNKKQNLAQQKEKKALNMNNLKAVSGGGDRDVIYNLVKKIGDIKGVNGKTIWNNTRDQILLFKAITKPTKE